MGLSPRTAGLASPPPVQWVLSGKPKPAVRGVLLVKSELVDDPRPKFIQRIDLTKTRVRAFEGFVFLCGGERGDDPAPIKSVRHMLYHELTSGRHSDIAQRLKLAEEIQDWFEGGNYDDLVIFEEHLAGLSAVIVLVVESAGAIAELGAFTLTPAILDRLLVVVAEAHYEQKSFIRLGPIRRLENSAAESVLVYDWHDVDYGGRLVERFDKVQDQLVEIIEFIGRFTGPSKSERLFRRDNAAHVKFLVCELCDLFGALSFSEIGEYLSSLGLPQEPSDLKRFLFLLEKCGLLSIKAVGHGRYYYPVEWTSRLSFAFGPGDPINKDRLKVDVAAFYEKSMKSRHEALRRARRTA